MIGSSNLHKWIEQYLFFPNVFQRLISLALLPLTVLYCVVTAFKRTSAKPHYFGIPVISIGNLIVGGSGKTPVAIALAKDKKDVCVVLRGYGRKSKGLHIVSNKGKILCDIDTSGDEAMLLANSLPNATIIVSENRSKAVVKAKELGCKVVFLDDGYSKHQLQKFDILIRPEIEPTNIFCLPSGGYRETKMMYAFADMILRDGTDFKRIVTFKKDNKTIEELPQNIVLLTAISKYERLLKFLPKDIKVISYPDHHYFTYEDLEQLKTQYPNFNIITTQKDFVKLKQFNLKNIYIMDLEIKINQDKIDKINTVLAV
ncbi:MAG: tetraacyldisaccharide 4'-kinase [Arcobacteraceae bacterium]|nr:tetraacyldisaccharide 4'-kinase [Arcobacteraceae bacterium]